MTTVTSVPPAGAAASAVPRAQYLRVPDAKLPEFWTSARIGHLRALAVTGRATERFAERHPGDRALDRLAFPALARAAARRAAPDPGSVEASTTLARGAIRMLTPLYFGDMSFGSLSGTPNVALARAADATGALAGTGEGGLHPEVARSKRITVQWASARFGVTPATLRAGLAVVIKVGQGAKPGVGGHLPASKVTDVIRRTRRIPAHRDAISPAPHHDIYSIEDLGQRIAALKAITGKPVLVKVAATNYAPFVACGVARMGADGIILDGAGAGTGAAPSVMKDHVGLPVELAVAGVDRMLAREGLREGFSVVAAGAVASPLDAARLMALGADCASIGTASLVAMGCVMVHKCHEATCPALLTTPAEDDPARPLDVDWITRLQVNLVRGWTEELRAIAHALGLARVSDLVARRDLLSAAGPLAADTAALFGVEAREEPPRWTLDAWTPRHDAWARALAGTGGKGAGEALVSSMGSTAPPFAEKAARPLDHLRLDGAQVTRPAIDSYREPVATRQRLANGFSLASPFALAAPSERPDLAAPIADAARRLGLLAIDAPPDDLRVLRVPSTGNALRALPQDRVDVDVVLVDEDYSPRAGRLPVEVFVAQADLAAGPDAPDLVACSRALRGAGDAAKLVALGAAAVALPEALARALAPERDSARFAERIESLARGWERELRLLLGAAGCSALPTLRGNRELLRAIDLDCATRESLGVKPAGWG